MTLKIGDIGYIDGDVSRPALILGLDKDDDGNEFVTYEALTGIRAARDTVVSHGDVQKAQDAVKDGGGTT